MTEGRRKSVKCRIKLFIQLRRYYERYPVFLEYTSTEKFIAVCHQKYCIPWIRQRTRLSKCASSAERRVILCNAGENRL